MTRKQRGDHESNCAQSMFFVAYSYCNNHGDNACYLCFPCTCSKDYSKDDFITPYEDLPYQQEL